MTRALVVALVMLVPVVAIAQEQRKPWSVDVGASWVVLGRARPTGGFGARATGRYTVPIGEVAEIGAGLTLGAFGLGGDSTWIGVLGGPEISAGARVTSWLTAGGGLSVVAGIVPECNDFGLCVPYLGVFPRASVRGLARIGEGFGVTATVASTYVPTLANRSWSWGERLALELGAAGVIAF